MNAIPRGNWPALADYIVIDGCKVIYKDEPATFWLDPRGVAAAVGGAHCNYTLVNAARPDERKVDTLMIEGDARDILLVASGRRGSAFSSA